MNLRILSLASFASLIAVFLLSGCNKEEPVSNYTAPKDPQLVTWSVPTAWQKAAYNHRLQYAGFSVGEGDSAVKITVSYLFPNANGAKDLLMNVNRWRRQLQLPAVTAGELGQLVTLTHQPNLTLQTVDIPAENGSRIRAAIVPRQDRIWFFKMTGTSEQIDEQKQSFDAFVRSVHYTTPEAEALLATSEVPANGPVTPSAMLPTVPTPIVPLPTAPLPTAPPIPSAGTEGELRYDLPAGWTREPNANGMRIATLSTGGEKPAQMIVTRLSANFGGMTLNLNRWRGEVGLPPADSNTESKESPIVIGSIPGFLVDLAGPGKDGKTPSRSLIARCTQGDSVWFFKLQGPAETITQQLTAYQAFLLSVRLPGQSAKS